MSNPMQDDVRVNPEVHQTETGVEDDELQFAEETEVELPQKSWKILIVDDEVEIHDITKLALSDVTFEDRSLTFLSAYSAAEAQSIMQAHTDIAIVLLDVVMETDDAGLQLINYIREDLDNFTTRIILRTGQPGHAPEDIVAVNYGIDDYKTKTELTARKLFISIITGLRTFSTIIRMMETSQHLESQLIQDRQTNTVQEETKILQLERKLQSLQNKFLPSHQRPADVSLETSTSSTTAENITTGSLQVMSVVSRIARMVLRIMDGQSTQLGLSQSKLGILLYLSSEPELCAKPSALAKHCSVSRAAMTKLLDGLEQEGYVERARHPSDRRALVVKLMQPGQDFLKQITPKQYQLPELMTALDATERQTLIELIINFTRLIIHQPDKIDE